MKSENLTIEDCLDIVKELSKTISIKGLNSYLKRNYVDVYNLIENKTIFLNKFKRITYKPNKIDTYLRDISITERIYCIEHNLTDRPKCKHCNKEYVYDFDRKNNQYKEYCSISCSKKSKEYREKYKKICLERYGVENVSQSDYIKTKKRDVYLERYGVENISQLDEIKQKVRETNLRLFGYTHPNKDPEIFKHTKETNLEKYGCEYSLQNRQIRDKGVKTKILKYGAKNNTTLYSYNLMLQNEYDEPIFTLEEYNKRKDTCELLSFRCKKCGHIFNVKHNHGHHLKCPICFPYNRMSQQEIDFSDFIKSIYSGNIIRNTFDIISPYELDIYLPDINIAFEYNGEYWHKEGFTKPVGYHLMKTKMCYDKGISLYHIWERYWINRTDYIKKVIENIINKW